MSYYYRRLDKGCLCRNSNECNGQQFCCYTDSTCQADCRSYSPPGVYPNMTDSCGASRDPSLRSVGRSSGSQVASILSSIMSCVYFYICIACIISCLRRRSSRYDDSSDSDAGGRPVQITVIRREVGQNEQYPVAGEPVYGQPQPGYVPGQNGLPPQLNPYAA